LGKELSSVAFEFQEHNAIAELGVAGHDTSADSDRGLIEPKGGVYIGAQDQGHHELYVTATAAKIGGLEAKGDIAAFLANFDGNLDGIATVDPALGMSEGGGSLRLSVRKDHGIDSRRRS
jgi:hypothetical protein